MTRNTSSQAIIKCQTSQAGKQMLDEILKTFIWFFFWLFSCHTIWLFSCNLDFFLKFFFFYFYFNNLINFYHNRGNHNILECFQGYHLTSGATEIAVTCVAGVWTSTSHPRMLLKCLPKCEPICENGGLCVGPDRCLCSGGFGGDRCQHYFCMERDGVLYTFHSVTAVKSIKWVFLIYFNRYKFI